MDMNNEGWNKKPEKKMKISMKNIVCLPIKSAENTFWRYCYKFLRVYDFLTWTDSFSPRNQTHKIRSNLLNC